MVSSICWKRIESVDAQGNILFAALGPYGNHGVFDYSGIKVTGGADTDYIKALYDFESDGPPLTITHSKGDSENSVTFFGSNLADTFNGGQGETFVLSVLAWAQDVISLAQMLVTKLHSQLGLSFKLYRCT